MFETTAVSADVFRRIYVHDLFGFVALSSLTSSQSSASFPLTTTRPSPSQSSSAGAILDISIVVGPPVDVEGRDAEVGGVGPVDVGFETVTSSV